MTRYAPILLAAAFAGPALAKSPPQRIAVQPVPLDDAAVTYSLPLFAQAPSGKPVLRPPADEDKRPETALELARTLGLSGDDSRPDQQLETTLLGKRLVIGGELVAASRFRTGYALTPGASDDDLSFDPEAKLEAIWLPGETTVVFASAKVFAETTPYKQGGKAEAAGGVQLDELWLLKTRLAGTPLAVQVGRQQIQDRREWWWDEELDALRLHYFGKKVTAFVGVGREFGHKSTLGRLDPEDRGIVRYFGNVRWDWADRQQVEFYALHHDDRSHRGRPGELVRSDRVDESDARLTWLGLRARGRVKAKFPGKFYYWADIAQVRGTDHQFEFDGFDAARDIVAGTAERTVRGWAFDAGISLELPVGPEPYLTLAYARGSGDGSRGAARDGAFRQTGLHNNNGKFRGLSRFRYYGEVLRPDLSNIAIITAALGVPVGKHSWLETIWHRYRQPVPSDRIAGSRLDIDPGGIDGRLGDEIDAVFSHRPPSQWEFEFTAGAFRAGPAFAAQRGRWAGLAEIKIKYNF